MELRKLDIFKELFQINYDWLQMQLKNLENQESMSSFEEKGLIRRDRV